MVPQPNKLTLEKLEIHQRLLLIEQYIIEGTDQRTAINNTLNKIDLRCKNIELVVHGNPDSYDQSIQDGIKRRIEFMEKREKETDKIKGEFLKIAIGAITLAVGSCMLWIFRLIWKSAGKGL